MNVSLVSKRNVPDDAIISIRSGAVRRQGAANANKPFVFPQSAVDGSDCVVKVDIMQNIGSGYIVLRPNQKEGRQYEVVLGDNDMACEINIDPTGVASPSAPAEDDAATAKTKQAAKQYLDGTGLLPFVQGVLQVIAKQQPQDPFAAMAKHFNSASDEAVAPMPGSPKAAPTSPTKAMPESPKATPDSPKAAPESPKAEAVETAEEIPPAGEEAAPPAEAAVGTPRAEATDDSEQKAPPPAAEAPAEGQAEASKADKEEDDVDDHKSVDDVDVQFTATIRGKSLVAEAEEEKPAEQAQSPEGGTEGEEKAEDASKEGEEKMEDASKEGEEKMEDGTKEGEEKAEDAPTEGGEKAEEATGETPAADVGEAEAGAAEGTAE